MKKTAFKYNVFLLSCLTVKQRELFCFFAGLILAFIGCVFAGHATTQHNYISNFNRFHFYIAPETNFYMPVRQTETIVKDLVGKDKIAVIIGGSSVFNGLGQPAGQTLAEHLQNELGNRFKVVNLALRASSPTNLAMFIVEKLQQENIPVIYVADEAIPTPFFITADPSNTEARPDHNYARFYWDAYHNHTMYDWLPRNMYARQFIKGNEVYSGAAINHFLYFNELWTYISYNYFSTFYNSITKNKSLLARKQFEDPETFQPFQNDNFQQELKIVSEVFAEHPPGVWEDCIQSWRDFMPAMIRKNSIMVLIDNSPFYFPFLDPKLLQIRQQSKIKEAKILEEIGMAAYIPVLNETDDFHDRTHMSPQGAKKLAQQLKPAVLERAKALGYTK